MKVARSVLVVIIAFGAAGAFAAQEYAQAADWTAQVARLDSKPVQGATASTELVSTAFVFVQNGHAYALAPESRVYASSDATAFSHQIQIQGEGSFDADFVAAEPGLGLALLELRQPTARVLSFVLPPLEDPSTQVGAGVRVAGVDGASASLTVVNNDQGQLLSAGSDRHAIPLLTDAGVLEVLGAAVGRTEVGAVVQAKDGGWLGVISNQFLKLQPGQPSYLGFWTMESAEFEGQLISIPAQVATQWIGEVLAGKAVVHFRVSPQDRLLGVARITTGGLEFTQTCPPPAAPQPVDGSFPIGGGDGAGIGGSVTTGRACKLKLTLAAVPTGAFGIASQQKWHDRWVADLQKNAGLSLELWYEGRRDPIEGHPERWVFGAVEEFLRDFGRPLGLEPVALYTPKGQTAPGLDPALKPMRTAAQATAQLVSAWLSSPTSISTYESQSLVRQIYFESLVLQSEDEALVQTADLDFLLDDKVAFQSAWGFVEAYNGVGQKLYTLLQALRAELGKLQTHGH